MKFLKSLAHKNLSNEICVLRIDLNVEDKSNFRLLAVVPTLKLLQRAKAKIVIISHEGRPAPQRRGISNSKFPRLRRGLPDPIVQAGFGGAANFKKIYLK